MAKRIEVIGSAIVITDTITSSVELDVPAKNAWYSEAQLIGNNIVEIIFIKNGVQGVRKYPLADTVDLDGVPFTVQTFKDFVHLNLGYDNGASKPKI